MQLNPRVGRIRIVFQFRFKLPKSFRGIAFAFQNQAERGMVLAKIVGSAQSHGAADGRFCFRELGLHWPFPRRTHAELIERAASDGALVIAFDLLFAEATNAADDRRMADAIRHARNVVLAKTRGKSLTSVSREWTLVEPLPALVEAGARTGEVGVDPDADFVVRMMPSFADSFDREIVRLARGKDAAEASNAVQTLVRYEGPHGSFPTVHYYQPLSPGMLPAGFFKDKIVLIGLDVHASPEVTRRQADLYNSPFLDAEGGVSTEILRACALRAVRPRPYRCGD